LNLIVFHPLLDHIIAALQMELYDLQVMFSSLFFSAPHKPQAKHWEACSPILEKRGKIISGEDDGGEGEHQLF
jgi:hypothetical protein